MTKFWNFIRDEAGERVLRLDGAIFNGDAWFIEDGITAKKFREDLNADEGDITLWLNSEGGDVFAAVEIYNMLKDYSDNHGLIKIKIDSLCASAASIVAMAGDEIEISAGGMIMIHNPATIAAGDAGEMKAAAKMLNEVKESIINVYMTRAKVSRAELSRMMDIGTWLGANQAVEIGFADKIIGAEAQSANDSPLQAYVRWQVTNSLGKAVKAKREVEKKKAAPDNRVDAAQLNKRLTLIR